MAHLHLKELDLRELTSSSNKKVTERRMFLIVIDMTTIASNDKNVPWC